MSKTAVESCQPAVAALPVNSYYSQGACDRFSYEYALPVAAAGLGPEMYGYTLADSGTACYDGDVFSGYSDAGGRLVQTAAGYMLTSDETFSVLPTDVYYTDYRAMTAHSDSGVNSSSPSPPLTLANTVYPGHTRHCLPLLHGSTVLFRFSS